LELLAGLHVRAELLRLALAPEHFEQRLVPSLAQILAPAAGGHVASAGKKHGTESEKQGSRQEGQCISRNGRGNVLRMQGME
jgi:hypothetical protein